MSRNIINISLPTKMVISVKKEVARGNYASVSEFFRDLLRKHEEDKILRELKASQEDIRRGKGKRLRSLGSLR